MKNKIIVIFFIEFKGNIRYFKMKIYFDVIIVRMKKDAVYQKEMRLKFCFELLGFDTFKTVSVLKSFIMKKLLVLNWS